MLLNHFEYWDSFSMVLSVKTFAIVLLATPRHLYHHHFRRVDIILIPGRGKCTVKVLTNLFYDLKKKLTLKGSSFAKWCQLDKKDNGTNDGLLLIVILQMFWPKDHRKTVSVFKMIQQHSNLLWKIPNYLCLKNNWTVMERILKPYVSLMKFSQNLIMKFIKSSGKLTVWIATAANRRKCRQFRARQKTTYSIWIVRDRKPSLLSNQEQVILYKIDALFLHSDGFLAQTIQIE